MEQVLNSDHEIWSGNVSPVERTRLVRYFARQTGNADTAEDLTQETLIEAWRHADRLIDVEGHERWLFGIACNVGRRWARVQGREYANRISPNDLDLDELPGEDDEISL